MYEISDRRVERKVCNSLILFSIFHHSLPPLRFLESRRLVTRGKFGVTIAEKPSFQTARHRSWQHQKGLTKHRIVESMMIFCILKSSNVCICTYIMNLRYGTETD